MGEGIRTARWSLTVSRLGFLLMAGCGSADSAPSSHEAPAQTEEAPSGEATDRGANGFLAAPFTTEVTLENAAYDTPGAPSAVVHVSPAFDPTGPLRVAVVLHGWHSCARQLAYAGPTPCLSDGSDEERPGYGLIDRFDASNSSAIFVVAQLAFQSRSGSPGRFSDEGGFRRFVGELLGSISQASLSHVESVSIFAHSAGFQTALAVIQRGQLPIRHVVLFDALYRGTEVFGAWALEDERRRLVSIYTRGGRTAQQSARLAQITGVSTTVADEGWEANIASQRVVAVQTTVPHGDVPAAHLTELLAPLGLAPSTLTAP